MQDMQWKNRLVTIPSVFISSINYSATKEWCIYYGNNVRHLISIIHFSPCVYIMNLSNRIECIHCQKYFLNDFIL